MAGVASGSKNNQKWIINVNGSIVLEANPNLCLVPGPKKVNPDSLYIQNEKGARRNKVMENACLCDGERERILFHFLELSVFRVLLFLSI